MKTMKTMMAAMLFMMASTACGGRDKVINETELPTAAKTMLKEHFPGQQVSLVQQDRDGMKTNYDVVLADGTKLEFDSKGEWTEVDSKPHDVPATIVPKAISDCVNQKFQGARIVQIERDRRGYEVELSNGIDMKFNKEFRLTEIDD